MSEVGGSNLARPPPLGPIRHTLKRHRPFPCSDPTFAPPPELRHLLDPERKIAAEAAAGPGEPKEESIFAKLHMLEAESCRTKTVEWAVGQGHSKPAASHTHTSVSKAIGKRNNKQKVLKNGKNAQQIPGSNADSPPDNSLTPSNSCRYDSSLGLLTKKFVNLIKYAEDGSIDLNQAAETLEVQKRRIYDITNVLEGIGLIEKQLKNRIRWKGSDASRPGDMDSEAARLKAEVANLYFEDLALDEEIREMQDSLRMLSDDPKNQRFLYVTQDDIKNLPCFQNETLISIKAPHGTTLEVPDPDDNDGYPQRRYQMLLRSMLGPIEVFLVSHLEDTNQVRLPDSAMDMSAAQELYTQGDHDAGTLANVEVQDRDVGTIYSQPSSSGIMKIIPHEESNGDADYWLLSEPEVGITEMWTSNVNSDRRKGTELHPG
ncbi:transcription factor E2FB-like isoform X2 [Nymphaea colorata]|uniref:transcription factor E2FB-like isoform X2 n=1 Tax=Nymphaea colorata TaxID=210225 RepID=UPI00129D8202|nr:transcription factor E2FB-like isoform X2 [Nymphaea colorata]